MPRSRRSASLPVLLFLTAFAAGLAVTWRGLNLLDEGALVNIAERLLSGEVLYRDVATGLTPGSYLLQAVLFRVFGPHLIPGRVLMALLLALGTLFVFLTLERWAERLTAICFAGAFFLWQAIHWRFVGYSCEANTLVLAALLLLSRWVDRRRPHTLFAAGLLVGVAAVFKQNTGAYAAIGLCGFLLLERWLLRGRSREGAAETMSRLLLAVGGIVLPVASVTLYFALHGALAAFFRSVVILPFSVEREAFALPYVPLFATFETASEVVRANLSEYSPLVILNLWAHDLGISWQSIFVLAQVHYYLPLLLLLVAGWLYLGSRRVSSRLPVAARSVRIAWLTVSAVLFLGVFPRADYHHLVLATPSLAVVGGFVARDLIALSRRPLLLGALVTALFIPWVALNALVTISWVHFPDPAERNSVWLDLPRAGVLVTRHHREHVRAVVTTIREATGDDELAILSPHVLYYFLAEKRNPLRFPLVLPGALDEREVIETLEKKSVRFVLFQSETINHRRFSQDLPQIYRYLKTHYRATEQSPVAGLPTDLSLLERGAVEPPREQSIGLEPGTERRGEDWKVSVDLIASLPQAELLLASPWASFRRRVEVGPFLRPSGWLFKDAILATAGAGLRKTLITYRLALPPTAALRTAVGVRPSNWQEEHGDGALFEIYLYEPGGTTIHRLFGRYLDPTVSPGDRRWQPVLIDLGAWAGQQVALTLATSGGPRLNYLRGKPDRPDDLAGWGEPAIVVRERSSGGVARVVRDPVPLPEEVVTGLAEFTDVELFERAAARHPADADIAYALGIVYQRLDRPFAAIEEYQRAWSAGIKQPALVRLFALALRRVGRTRQLEDFLLEASAEFPDETFPLTLLAAVYEQERRAEEARRLLEMALEMDPGDVAIRHRLERLRIDRKGEEGTR